LDKKFIEAKAAMNEESSTSIYLLTEEYEKSLSDKSFEIRMM